MKCLCGPSLNERDRDAPKGELICSDIVKAGSLLGFEYVFEITDCLGRVDSPLTRHKKFRRLSVMVLRSIYEKKGKEKMRAEKVGIGSQKD